MGKIFINWESGTVPTKANFPKNGANTKAETCIGSGVGAVSFCMFSLIFRINYSVLLTLCKYADFSYLNFRMLGFFTNFVT